jgi:hypothetical protein
MRSPVPLPPGPADAFKEFCSALPHQDRRGVAIFKSKKLLSIFGQNRCGQGTDGGVSGV